MFWQLCIRGATGDAQAGKRFMNAHVGCHGPTGQGGRMAAMLAVPPRNLADQAYMGTRSDQLFDVISKGGAATGLSAAMTAFGSQLSEQRSGMPWHTSAPWLLARKLLHRFRVAHRRRPVHPTADLVMARLRLSIWLEYDDPRVLIMFRGEMTPRQAFPASITLPIPKGAEIIGAGMVSEQNELLLHPHQILPGNTQHPATQPTSAAFFWNFITTPSPRVGQRSVLSTLLLQTSYRTL